MYRTLIWPSRWLQIAWTISRHSAQWKIEHVFFKISLVFNDSVTLLWTSASSKMAILILWNLAVHQVLTLPKTLSKIHVHCHAANYINVKKSNIIQFDGILPKEPYPPCVSMAGRAFLAGYPRLLYTVHDKFIYIYFQNHSAPLLVNQSNPHCNQLSSSTWINLK